MANKPLPLALHKGTLPVHVSIACDADSVAALADAFDTITDNYTCFEQPDNPDLWQVDGYVVPTASNLAAIDALIAAWGGALSSALLENRDWLAENLQDFPPLAINRFYIYGSHISAKPPVATLPLQIDAATAFGTGEHATTQGCLQALAAQRKRMQRLAAMLDIGCGTGILAFAAQRLWPMATAVASDIDAGSITIARQFARRNQLHGRSRFVIAAGYRHRQIRGAAPVSLIACNILARPLCTLAPQCARHLRPGGITIAAGLLVRQQQQVIHAYRKSGLILRQRYILNGWAILVFQKPY